MPRDSLLMRLTSAAIVLLSSVTIGQERVGGHFSAFVQGNERLGLRLLADVQAVTPDTNIAVCPISLSMLFGSFYGHSIDASVEKELHDVFGFPYVGTEASGRMLLSVFRPLAPVPSPPVRAKGPPPPPPRPATEGAWIRNAIAYRASGTLSERFVNEAKSNFGVSFTSTGNQQPALSDLDEARALDKQLVLRERHDLLLNSGMHLRTSWSGNTFSLSEARTGEFHVASGSPRVVQVLTSEMSTYPYAKTNEFEAVALACHSAYFVAVLPQATTTLAQLVRQLAESPALLRASMSPRAGMVDFPPFAISFRAPLERSLQSIGLRRVFESLDGIVTIPRSHLTFVQQHVNLHVDRLGIRADAETVGGGIYGGVMGGVPAPFHMKLNRPFLFLIRDNVTDALLFVGLVMDPSRP